MKSNDFVVNFEHTQNDIVVDFSKTNNNVELDFSELTTIESGSGYTPVKGVDYWNDEDKEQIISEIIAQIPNNTSINVGHALYYDMDGQLNVAVSSQPEADNTLPITSAAVDTVVGNINVLLQTI